MSALAEPSLRDLPVALCLPDPLGAEVRAWVEGELGWQVVPVDGPPRPALVLRAAGDARAGCVVLADGEVDTATLRAALAQGARDALGWPGERQRLAAVARRPQEQSVAAPPVWRVAGTAGGVGTSTVALAVAGLAAWAGRKVLVTGDDDLLGLCGIGAWQGPGIAEIAALGAEDAGVEVDRLARQIAGVDGLRALGGRRGTAVGAAGWPADLVVADAGVALPGQRVDLLVTAPDARAAKAGQSDAPLLVVGDGPLDRRGIASAAGRRHVGWLPSSARVARAALAGRVPASVPGSWLRQLRRVLAVAARA